MADRKSREADPSDSFDGGYHLWAQEQHKKRVAKNPQRVEYAKQQFEKNGIRYCLKNQMIGHFHCWRLSDNKLFQFYAGTGKIMGMNKRGLANLVKELRK